MPTFIKEKVNLLKKLIFPAIRERGKEGQLFEPYRPQEAISEKKKHTQDFYIFQTLYLTICNGVYFTVCITLIVMYF